MKDFPAYGKGNTGRLHRSQEKLPTVASLKFLTILGLLLGVALFFVAQRIEFTRTERRIRDLLVERRKITESILPIKLEVYNLSRLGRIEEVAKGQLQLHDPYESQLIRPVRIVAPLEPEEPSSLGSPAPGEPVAPENLGPDKQVPEE